MVLPFPRRRKSRWAVLSIALIALLLTLAPFATALEIHHALAEADQDGHQHADFDLCQWVQLHSSSSVDLGLPDQMVHTPPRQHESPATTLLIFASIAESTPPRAPPLS